MIGGRGWRVCNEARKETQEKEKKQKTQAEGIVG